jgi:hypothetical protein
MKKKTEKIIQITRQINHWSSKAQAAKGIAFAPRAVECATLLLPGLYSNNGDARRIKVIPSCVPLSFVSFCLLPFFSFCPPSFIFFFSYFPHAFFPSVFPSFLFSFRLSFSRSFVFPFVRPMYLRGWSFVCAVRTATCLGSDTFKKWGAMLEHWTSLHKEEHGDLNAREVA